MQLLKIRAIKYLFPGFSKVVCLVLLFLSGGAIQAQQAEPTLDALLRKNLQEAGRRYLALARATPAAGFPRTEKDGRLVHTSYTDWTSGFYPGALLYLYEFSGNAALLAEAQQKMNLQKPLQFAKNTHDLGFMLNCSVGNAYRLQPDAEKKAVLVQAARSLASRFNARTGCIESWNQVLSTDGKTVLHFPVIIDNMLNLELLYVAAALSGDTSLSRIADSHAFKTRKNHLRKDHSSYHVVNYDEKTGEPVQRETHQGFAHSSTWARGQAWGIYGFTMAYRYSKHPEFLRTAVQMADYFLNHPNLPADGVPYWDFDAGRPGLQSSWPQLTQTAGAVPRDASAAAVVASALLDLAGYTSPAKASLYRKQAARLLRTLSSPAYFLAGKTGHGFLIAHNTGNLPAGYEIDSTLCYADYYYLEAALKFLKGVPHGR